MNEEKISFEGNIKKLEEIVKQLEKGDLELESSMALFEEGVRLTAACETHLRDAEQKIIKLDKEGVTQ